MQDEVVLILLFCNKLDTRFVICITDKIIYSYVILNKASLQTEVKKANSRDKDSSVVTGFVSLCREMLTRFIDQHFPTQSENMVNQEIAHFSQILNLYLRTTYFNIKFGINYCFTNY